MQFNVFGNRNNPTLLCLHGMLLDWHGFYLALKPLEEAFCLIVPAGDGCYEGSTDFVSFAEECRQIEAFVKERFGGRLHGVYGSSQGATLACELLSRNQIAVDTAILDGVYAARQGKLAAAVGIWQLRKLKRNGGKPGAVMAAIMKLMGLSREDAGLFSAIYWAASEQTIRRNLIEQYTYRVRPEIAQSRTKVHLWCGGKEPYAKKSHRILKEYLQCSEERIFENTGHGEMLMKHRDELLALIREAL